MNKYLFKIRNYLPLVLIVIYVLPSLVQAAPPSSSGSAPSETLAVLVGKIEGILNLIIELLFILATVYFLWGVTTLVVGGDPKKIGEGRQHMLWGIIGMAVMFGAWGIVRGIASFIGD